MTRNRKGTVELSLQAFDPFTEGALAVRIEANEQMHVMRHDDVTAYADPVISCSTAIIRERGMNIRGRKERVPTVSIEADEKNWRVVFLKDPLEARRFPLALRRHGKRCSVRCPQRTGPSVSEAICPLGQRTLQR